MTSYEGVTARKGRRIDLRYKRYIATEIATVSFPTPSKLEAITAFHLPLNRPRSACSQAVEPRFELQDEVNRGFDGRLKILGLTGRHLTRLRPQGPPQTIDIGFVPQQHKWSYNT